MRVHLTVRALFVNESNCVLIYCSTVAASNAYIEVILCTLHSASIVAVEKSKNNPTVWFWEVVNDKWKIIR